MDTWTASSQLKNHYAGAFLACGVLYAINYSTGPLDGYCAYCEETTVDFSWNWSTGATGAPGMIFTSPGGSATMNIGAIDFNARDGKIYAFRGGYMGLITPTWD
jgi:hypothetical protein